MTQSDKNFYCLSCREKHHATNVTMEQTLNGRYRLCGKCVHCGTKVSKFISEDKARSFKRMSANATKKKRKSMRRK